MNGIISDDSCLMESVHNALRNTSGSQRCYPGMKITPGSTLLFSDLLHDCPISDTCQPVSPRRLSEGRFTEYLAHR